MGEKVNFKENKKIMQSRIRVSPSKSIFKPYGPAWPCRQRRSFVSDSPQIRPWSCRRFHFVPLVGQCSSRTFSLLCILAATRSFQKFKLTRPKKQFLNLQRILEKNISTKILNFNLHKIISYSIYVSNEISRVTLHL